MVGSGEDGQRESLLVLQERSPIEFAGLVISTAFAIVVGVTGLVLESRRGGSGWLIAVIMMLLLLGMAGAVVIIMEIRDWRGRTGRAPGRGRPNQAPKARLHPNDPVIVVDSSGSAYAVLRGAPIGNYIEAAARRNLGVQESVYPSFPVGRFYLAVLMPVTAFFTLLLALMYFGDGSVGLGACACTMTIVAAVLFGWALSKGRHRPGRTWIVYTNGLSVVDPNGEALRTIRWAEVVEWEEHGRLPDPVDPPAYPPPYQLRLYFNDYVPALELQGQEIVGITGLRDCAVKAIRRHNPACRGLPAKP